MSQGTLLSNSSGCPKENRAFENNNLIFLKRKVKIFFSTITIRKVFLYGKPSFISLEYSIPLGYNISKDNNSDF